MNERLLSSTSYPMVFFMASAVDHMTGLTGLSPTVTISKNGAALAAPSGAVTETIGGGWYQLAGNATDRNTLGEFILHATATGADTVDKAYTIVAYNPFDVLNLGLTGLREARQSLTGKTVINRDAGTIEIYDEAGSSVIRTGTLTTEGNVDTITWA